MPLSVEARGSGDETDVALVQIQLAGLPEPLQAILHAQGLRVLACRNSITDARQDLIGVRPRGWPEGQTWDLVPGAYLPDEKAVVVATVPDPDNPGRRRVPPQGWMHNAFNLLIHETLHADDYLQDRLRCHNPAFVSAREADFAALHAYEQQDGDAGLEETYAESASRFFGNDPALETEWPNLAAFWKGRDLPVEPGRRSRDFHGPTALGLARLTADGAYELDLRAEDDDGAIGHALIQLEAGTPAYDELERRRRRERALVGEWMIIKPF
ncbi:hypothetical protein [Brevundimonas sp. Root1279]|uniref:hypothetical protein n=1 Tax=Brevundimonas sp. Root1279 TaxID=1736443 RepID=UPI0006F93F62|nr:hypothetical protein [Brevundimonas sp. Root1279]KQW80779.1 hypothetical protein ASC65_12445 [Brevundimonas sp. Root1279]